MLYQFAILLLAALLGIAGSVDVIDSALRKTLTPIVISKHNLTFLQPGLQLFSYTVLKITFFMGDAPPSHALATNFVYAHVSIVVYGSGGSRLYAQDTSESHCNTNGEMIRIWINTSYIEEAPDCIIKQFM